ncbi:MAG: HIT family protein [Phycisphaerales bacterium]|nr:HIT family protein [Phycisphaerales bacterium]
MSCPLCQQIELAKSGKHPRVVADMRRTLVVLGDNQGLPGWCVLILKRHEEHLADLSVDEQMALFREVALVGNAVRAVCQAARVNYECLGNQVSHVHWHVIPRYGAEVDPDPASPVWGFDPAKLKGNQSPEEAADLLMRLRGSVGK